MEKTNFSVLLSVYKNEKPNYLIECFKSIYENQELKPDEIVLVQDGPLTDELYEVIKNLKSQLKNILKIVPIEKNVRLGNALRIGIENCSNEIIARMDTDDIAFPNRFKKQIKFLEENPEVDVLGSYMNEFIDNITNVVAIKTAPLKDFKNYMKMRDPVNHPSVVFKKSKVLDAGNYIEILYNEDSYLWGRMLANKCQFANLDEPLIYFRVNDDTYKRRGGFQYVKAEIQLQKEFLRLGIINKFEFLRNITLKNIVRIIPNELRKKIYLKLLRKNS
ncbi:MAG: glycosyltransferase [Clostridia bacterium]